MNAACSINCVAYWLKLNSVLSFEQGFILIFIFPLLLAFLVGGLSFEFCVFVAGWRHALRSEWPFIIIIIIIGLTLYRHRDPALNSRGAQI